MSLFEKPTQKLSFFLLSLPLLFQSVSAFAIGCTGETKVSITSIFNINNYTPVIPASCSGAIGLDSLPGILVRGYGLMTAIVWQLSILFLFINGILWIWGGLSGDQTSNVKKNFSKTLWALGMTLGAYLIVNTVVSVLSGGSFKPTLNGILEYNV
jgi:predicted permease